MSDKKEMVQVSREDLEKLRAVWLFLDGQGELSDCVFGEKPEGRHNYWWRRELREAFEAVYASPTVEIELPYLFPFYRQEVTEVLNAAGLKVKPC